MHLSLKRFFSAAFVCAISGLSWAGTLSSVSVTPTSNTTGATTDYTFTYTLASDVNADEALLYVTFPNDFTVAAGACDRIVSFTLNPSPGAAICKASYGSGNTVGFAVNTSIGGGFSVPSGTVVTVVVGGVTNPSTAGNYNFDPAAGISSSTGIYTTQAISNMMPMIMEKDSAPQQTVTIGSGSLVNGACGASNAQIFTSAPSGGLCTTGTASAVTTNATNYTWACNGSGGGTNASCSANKGYDLILSISPNSSGSANCTSNPVIHGGSTTCTPTPAPGYSFSNWSGDCSGATCVLSNVTSSKNPQANFVANTYVIATTVNPSTAATISCTSNPVTNGSNSTCTYTANPGYTFTNWSGDCTGASCVLTGVTAAKSVTANFTAPSYAITANVSPGGAGTASCTPNPVTGGSNSTCTASANSGYVFNGWTGDCTGSTCVLGFVSSAKTVTANFTLVSYGVNSSAQPASGGSVTCPSNISSGANGTCSATANTGYTFSGWSGCSSSSGTICSLTSVTSNQTVTANFSVNSYTVTGAASPADKGTVSCSSPVDYSKSASCTVSAVPGYRLKNWSGACSGTSCSIASVTANSTVTANLEVVPTYNVTTSVAPTDSGRISCTKNVLEGSTATCNVIANDGYKLTSWGGDCSGTDAICSLTNVTGNKSVSATFAKASVFTISASQLWVNADPISIGINGEKPSTLNVDVSCSASNPVTSGTTVTCSVSTFGSALKGQFLGWGGDCSRVEGEKCIIDNIASDKHLIVNRGFLATGNANIKPAGAGVLWCDSISFAAYSFTPNYAQNHCKAIANPGYVFSSYTLANGSVFDGVDANFTVQGNTPVVSCSSCQTNTTSTFSNTITTLSQGGSSIGQIVSPFVSATTITDISTGSITTGISVGTSSATGSGQGGTVSTTDRNANVTVGSDSATLVTNNPTTGTTSTAVATQNGANVTTTGAGNTNTVSTGQGQSILLTQTGPNTSLAVTDNILNSLLGSTTTSGNTVTTTNANNSSTVTSTLVAGSASTSTTYGAGTVTTTSAFGTGSVSVTQLTGGTGSVAASIASSQTATIISGAATGGFTSIGSGSFSSSNGGGLGGAGTGGVGGFGGGSVTVRIIDGLSKAGAKPSMRKISPADDHAQAAIDITGGTLQSVQLYTDSRGLVEFFKPSTAAGSPQMTAFESTADAFSITLSYPAKK